jgi:hypothetical protein
MAHPWMHGQSSVNDALRARSLRAEAVAGDDAAPVTPPGTLDASLQAMFASADVVFTGEVSAVERGEDVVTVRFTVEDGIRGVSDDGNYSLREWSGLWADNPARYAVGQHLLMLLHAPSVAGLASPVSDGAIPLSGDAVTGTADLRWVALHTAVTDAAQMRPMTMLHAAGARMQALADGNDAMSPSVSTAAVAFDVVNPTASDTRARIDRAVVVEMLHAWQQHAVRAQ